MITDLLTRRAAVCLLIAAFALAPAGCKNRRKVRVQQTEEEAPGLASTVHTSDPRAAGQLISGFYDVEQNAWRWTAGKFSVLLRPPRATPNGATLQLKFSVPDPVIAQLKAVTLEASINNTRVARETYTQAGEFTLSADVPAALLKGDAVKVDFALDKALPPGQTDQRELGVVVAAVGLEAK